MGKVPSTLHNAFSYLLEAKTEKTESNDQEKSGRTDWAMLQCQSSTVRWGGKNIKNKTEARQN